MCWQMKEVYQIIFKLTSSGYATTIGYNKRGARVSQALVVNRVYYYTISPIPLICEAGSIWWDLTTLFDKMVTWGNICIKDHLADVQLSVWRTKLVGLSLANSKDLFLVSPWWNSLSIMKKNQILHLNYFNRTWWGKLSTMLGLHYPRVSSEERYPLENHSCTKMNIV